MNTISQHPDDLLAFYVNGTLSDAEQQEVETHIAECARCQNEIVLLRTMRDVSRQQQTDEFPQEFAWQRLKRDIKQQASTGTTNRSQTWWQPTVGIAAALIIMVQAVLIFDLKGDADSYSQAGYQHDGVIVQMRVNPQATEKQLRDMLLIIDAEIVAGPSASGLYRIRLSEQQDDPAVAEKLQALKENNELIHYLAEE